MQPIEAGRAALARASWRDARAAFEAALVESETPEALEGLGLAARWLNDASASLGAYERAFTLFRASGDEHAAARVAIQLGITNGILRGDIAIALGWLGRAERLLEHVELSAEHGWLAVYRAHVAISVDHDVVAAQPLAETVESIGRALRDIDLEMLGRAQVGTILVSRGDVRDGMQRLDEATTAAVSGEMSHPDAISTACCYLITACYRVRDFDRAAQWCDRVSAIAERWDDPVTFAVCRTQYADLLILRGSWAEADSELAANVRDLAAISGTHVGAGLVRLAELRRRQGRADEARALVEEAGSHYLVPLVGGRLALDDGAAVRASELADRYLRRLQPDDLLGRVPALELIVRARIALSDVAGARAAADELRATATGVGTHPLLAAAAAAEGLVAAAGGDIEGGRRSFEDAVDLLGDGVAPFERGQLRLALAASLRDLDRRDDAVREAEAAGAALAALGAAREAKRAEALLRSLGAGSASAGSGDLTRREVEILELLAEGRSNQEIAAELVLSVRTVERHVANVYEKLGVAGKAARAAATAWALRHGLG